MYVERLCEFLPSNDKRRQRRTDVQQFFNRGLFSLLRKCVCRAVCLAIKGKKHITVRIHAVEMGSGALICVPSLIKIDSDIQTLLGGGGRLTDTHSMEIAFSNKESRIIQITR